MGETSFMKRFFVWVAIFFLSLSSFCNAQLVADTRLEQERMLFAEDAIYVLLSVENYDVIRAFSHSGSFIWEINFLSQVTSWQILGDSIVVFSKDRLAPTTYLTCLERSSGALFWERS